MEQVPGKTGQKPGFSIKSKEVVPKTEILEQHQWFIIFDASTGAGRYQCFLYP
jgi:hypothetical protein